MKTCLFVTILFFSLSFTHHAFADYDVIIGLADGTGLAYDNTGTPSSPVWTAKPAWNLPDIGTDNVPCFFDLDNDGDYDVLIGTSTGVCLGYENTGTSSSPVWTAKSAWNVPDIGASVGPTFADLDNDGDFDLMVGALDGISYGFRNTGTISSPTWTAEVTWNTPDLGGAAKPFLADLDNDGDKDMLIGISTGVALGYENTGTTSSPVWTAKTVWNMPDVGSDARPYGADLDNDGDMDLLIGEGLGNTNGYENTGTVSSPIWTAKVAWDIGDLGTGSAPALVNLDNDGLSVAVSNSVFAFGTQLLNTFLAAQSSVLTNDGSLTETLVGKISTFTAGANTWTLSPPTNGPDQIRAQWSTTSASGPWNDISAYDTDFTIATNVAVNGSVNFWLRIQTPTSTSSYNQYSSTLTVTAQ